jgi:hypothetical protein
VPNRDLAAEMFGALREVFFDEQGRPAAFAVRAKQNVQDDPFDEYVAKRLGEWFAAHAVDAAVVKSPGPLISPDMLLYRPSLVSGRTYGSPAGDPSTLVAVEVKKLERGSNGRVARASGLDYNTTPPCGLVRVYDGDGQPADMRSYYLFVCLETRSDGEHELSALSLCDGDALNEDFELYLSIVGARSKTIGLGTYGDGVNRERPMLIFSNPLGAAFLDRSVTLVHASDSLHASFHNLRQVGVITRDPVAKDRPERTFFCYRDMRDARAAEPFAAANPFPVPQARSEATQGRGRFQLPWVLT